MIQITQKCSSNFEIEEDKSTKANALETQGDGLQFNLIEKREVKDVLIEKQYIFWALLSALCYSVHNYSIAQAQLIWDEQTAFIILPEGFTWVITFLIYHVAVGIKRKKTNGKYWSKSESVIFDKSTRKLDQGILGVLMVRGIAATAKTICIAGIMYYAKEAGISPSAVFSVTSLSSFTTAVGFYFLYGEKLNFKHLVGMLLIMVGVVIIPLRKAFAQTYSGDQQGSQKEIIIAISLSLIFCLGMLISGVTMRMAVKKGYDAFQFTIDFHAFAGIIYIIGFSVSQGIWHTFSLIQVLFLQMPSLVVIFSSFFQNKAFIHGKGGLVSSISQLSRIFQLMFEIAIQNRIPNLFEIIALAFGIIGSLVITTSHK